MTDLRYDHLGYAQCHGLWICRRSYSGLPTQYYVCEGDHPHDPDGDSNVIPGPRPTTEQEAIAQAKAHRKMMLLKELEKLND